PSRRPTRPRRHTRQPGSPGDRNLEPALLGIGTWPRASYVRTVPHKMDASPDVVAKMLAYGRLLDESTGKDGRRMTDDLRAEIKRVEGELVELLSTTRSKSLQAILDFNNRGKPQDELVLRLVCCVAHGQIAGSGRTDVRSIVQAVAFDDDQQPVKARQLIFRLCVRRAFVVQDNYYGREQIILGEP